MALTILVVLFIGSLNSVFCQNVDLSKDLTLSVNSTDIQPETAVDLTLAEIDEATSKGTQKIQSTTNEKLSDTTKEEIRNIIGALDKKLLDIQVESLSNSTNPAENSSKVLVQLLNSRAGFPLPEEQFHYYSHSPVFEQRIKPSPIKAYNFHRIEDSRPGTFSIFDCLTPEHTVSLPVRQILEGPINIAVPLISHEISLYFVNRGLKSVKFTPSLIPINEALSRPVHKVGLTIPAAFSLRSRYLSWPVKSVVFAEPVFLADISNTATYPTVLFVPEDEFEVTYKTPDVFRIADFALLEDGIRYALPSTKQVI